MTLSIAQLPSREPRAALIGVGRDRAYRGQAFAPWWPSCSFATPPSAARSPRDACNEAQAFGLLSTKPSHGDVWAEAYHRGVTRVGRRRGRAVRPGSIPEAGAGARDHHCCD